MVEGPPLLGVAKAHRNSDIDDGVLIGAPAWSGLGRDCRISSDSIDALRNRHGRCGPVPNRILERHPDFDQLTMPRGCTGGRPGQDLRFSRCL